MTFNEKRWAECQATVFSSGGAVSLVTAMWSLGLCHFSGCFLRVSARRLTMRTSGKILFVLAAMSVFLLLYLFSLVKFSDHQQVARLDQSWQVVRHSPSANTTPVYRNVTRSEKTSKRNKPEVISARERAKYLQDRCRELQAQGYKLKYAPISNRSLTPTLRRFIADKSHALLYCPIEKVGCSFWKRLFLLLKGHKYVAKNTSLFDLSGVHIHKFNGLTKINPTFLRENPNFTKTVKKFMFVRDPYERLFSGFMDKIFTPTFETSSIARAIRNVHHPRKHARLSQKALISPPLEAIRPRSALREDVSFSDLVQEERNAGRHSHGESINEQSDSERDDNDDSDRLSYMKRGGTKDRSHWSRGKLHHSDDIIEEDNEDEGVQNIGPYMRPEGFLDGRQQQMEDSVEEFFEPGLIPESILAGENSKVDRHHHPRLERKVTQSRRCSVKVTFAEFVQYVINDVKVNVHFLPMSRRCPPCAVPYDFIGSIETFRRDVSDILKSSGADFVKMSKPNVSFDQSSDLNILHDVTERTFKVMQRYKSCMTPAESLRRTWITFQVRGFIALSQKFPLSEREAMAVTKDQFIRMANQAYAESGPREVRMRQRKTAMLDAFYSLPRHLLKDLESHFERDCLLFGYECSVDKRFSQDREPEPVFHFEHLMQDIV